MEAAAVCTQRSLLMVAHAIARQSISPSKNVDAQELLFRILPRRSVPMGVYRLSILLMFTFNAIARQSISAQGAVSRRVSTALRSLHHKSEYQSARTIVLFITKAQCPEGYLPPQYFADVYL